MRVRISYSLDIKNVPGKTAELIEETIEDLKKAVHSLDKIKDELRASEEEFGYLDNALDRVRKTLTKSDHTISDISLILGGLENYYNGDKNVPEGRPTMDSSGNTITQTTGTGD